MKVLVIIALVTLGQSSTSHVTPIGVTVGLTPYSHPISSLYHSQDGYGQYLYGYVTPTSSKSETKSADGTTQGGYSYIDSNGILQTVQYIADSVHGFRVVATNLPQDSPDVALAKAKHLSEYNAIATRVVPYSNPVVVPAAGVPQVLPQPVQDLPEVAQAKARHLAILQAAYNNPAAAPQPVQDLPEVIKARAEHLAAVEQIKARNAAINLSPIPAHISAPIAIAQQPQLSYTPAVWYSSPQSQYHAQDGLGQYSYGYVGPLSSKAESKSADGTTRGGYSYIDANGILQTVNYISDPVNGFRVAATNLPVAPKTTLIAPAPATVVKTVANDVSQVPSAKLYTQQIYY